MTDEWQNRIDANAGRVTAFDVDLEQAAEESAQDRRDHARLRALVLRDNVSFRSSITAYVT